MPENTNKTKSIIIVRKNFEDVFWVNVEKTNGCWFWMAGCTGKGYGMIQNGDKKIYVHRYSYELFKGEIPKGFHLDHLCRNPSCVNPDHLEAVSQKENLLRGIGIPAINSQKTHCKRGHPLSGNNLYINKRGRYTRRICKTCYAIKREEFKQRRKSH